MSLNGYVYCLAAPGSQVTHKYDLCSYYSFHSALVILNDLLKSNDVLTKLVTKTMPKSPFSLHFQVRSLPHHKSAIMNLLLRLTLLSLSLANLSLAKKKEEVFSTDDRIVLENLANVRRRSRLGQSEEESGEMMETQESEFRPVSYVFACHSLEAITRPNQRNLGSNLMSDSDSAAQNTPTKLSILKKIV